MTFNYLNDIFTYMTGNIDFQNVNQVNFYIKKC